MPNLHHPTRLRPDSITLVCRIGLGLEINTVFIVQLNDELLINQSLSDFEIVSNGHGIYGYNKSATTQI